MLDEIQKYALHIGARDEVLTWLSTTGAKVIKKGTLAHELEHILDYLNSDAAPKRLLKMSFIDAKRLADKWSAASQKKGRHLEDGPYDIDVVMPFPDGTRIVKLLSQDALKREGFLMSHCVGSYTLNKDRALYSYRDAKNMPHATFEVQTNGGQIMQIKGKGNGAIHPKYIHAILEFLKYLKMDIRPHDMINLGYYHVKAELLPAVKELGAMEQVSYINGEYYAY